MSKATEKAYQMIRDSIASGRFPAGMPLREAMLAELVQASRTPVREAIRRLHAEGYVDVRPSAGAVVSAWNAKRVADLAGIRAVLEGHAAFLAATRANSEQIHALHLACEEMEALLKDREAAKPEDFTAANNKFHHSLLEASDNEQLVMTAGSLMELALITETFRRFSPERLIRSCSDHQRIVEAIRSQDPLWAEATMRSHILASVTGSRKAEEGDKLA